MEHEQEALQDEERAPSHEDTRVIEHELERLSSTRSPLNLLIRAMKKYPPLRKRKEFNTLFRRYETAASPDEKKRLRDEIIYRNLALVMWVAKRFTGRGVPIEDLVQAGVIGLQEGAIPKFDIERGVTFSTYATWWIKHAISREVFDRRLDRPLRVPVHAQERWNKLRRLAASFAALHQREPTIEELSKLAGLDPKKLEEILVSDGSINRRAVSLDAPIGDDFQTLIEILDTGLGQDADVPLDVEWMRSKQRDALKEIASFTSMRQNVINSRFGLGVPQKTLHEIGVGYNLSRERIRQIEADAIGILAKRMRLDTSVVISLLDYIGAEDIVPLQERVIHPDTILDEVLEKAWVILAEHLKARTEYRQNSVLAAERTLCARMGIDISESREILEQLANKGRISPLQADESVTLLELPPEQSGKT